MKKPHLYLVLTLCVFGVESLGFVTNDLFTGFVAGVGTAKLIERVKSKDDPCSSKNCGNGRCVSKVVDGSRVAECICQPGFCGEDCKPSTESTDENCPNGICTLFGSVCVDGRCVCNCNTVAKPVTTLAALLKSKECVSGHATSMED